MRVKSNKALRRSARLARRASISSTATPPPATTILRGPALRGSVASSIAVTVAGILWGSGVPACAQEAPAPTTGSAQTSESLQEVVVTASATGVKKLDASYGIVSADAELIKEANPKSVFAD